MVKKKLSLIFLHYLRILAKIQLTKINFLRKLKKKGEVVIIGITGSVGKTSVMCALVAALKDSFKVKFSEKANSESGIPLNILGLKMKDFSFSDWLRVALLSPLMLLINWRDYDLYIVEMGVDEPAEPKNMSYLLKIIRPKIGVFIGVTSVHGMHFEVVAKGLKGVLKAIADEKAKLIASLPSDGYAILNLEDKYVRERKKLTNAKIIEGKRIKIEFKNYLLPEVYQINFGLALAAAQALGVSRKKATAGIKKHFSLPKGRSSLIKGIKKSLIIDSSYNASPKAVMVMLEMLGDQGKRMKRRKIAVLGDMRELGQQTKIEHQKIARKTVQVADEIILVGKEMKAFFLPQALKLGFDKSRIYSFLNPWPAADFLKEHLQGEELILIKGSQNTIFLEIVVQALMEEKEKAEELLCRRGEFWEKKRLKLLDY